jgi:hypothetical protein
VLLLNFAQRISAELGKVFKIDGSHYNPFIRTIITGGALDPTLFEDIMGLDEVGSGIKPYIRKELSIGIINTGINIEHPAFNAL